LYLNNSHPIFNYLKSDKIISNDFDTKEFLPSMTYEDIYFNIEQLFISGNSFSVMTNSFYHKNERLIGDLLQKIVWIL
jgi:hypothetical protein